MLNSQNKNMKKLSATLVIILSAFAAQAQDSPFDPMHDRQLYFDCLNIGAVMIVIYLISSFILQIIRQATTYRIKNRMLDRNTEVAVVREILQPDKKENKNYILQWFCMMAAIGAGLLLVNLTKPYGMHSLSILAFSLAAGFGAYYYFTREEKLKI